MAKGLLRITPHGALCPDLYPGSVSDNDINIVMEALDTVQKDDCILVDKGLALVKRQQRGGQ